ncbi:putative Cyclin-like superfamily [Helianthus annuus]|nr:putative Cyclin-like superfamily [Helianthus annuus]
MVPSSKKISAPVRNCFGTIGRECVIKAYHFLVDLGQKDEKSQFGNDVIFWLVDKYGINDVNDATKYYKIVVERGFTRGRITAQVAVAYLYVVCRRLQIGSTAMIGSTLCKHTMELRHLW